MSLKRMSVFKLPSVRQLKNANDGALIFINSNQGMEISNNVTIQPGNDSEFQLTASDKIHITGSTASSLAGNVIMNAGAAGGKLFISSSFDINTSTNFGGGVDELVMDSNLIGIDGGQISGSWIYKGTPSESNQTVRKNPDKSLNATIEVKVNNSGESYYEIATIESKTITAEASTTDNSVLYIDNSWNNGLSNNVANESRDIYIHKDTRVVIFDTDQSFYDQLQCRIFLPQTLESASHHSYTAPTSNSDFLAYDGSKIQFYFKKIPAISKTSNANDRSWWNTADGTGAGFFKIVFKGTTNPASVLSVPFCGGMLSEYSATNFNSPARHIVNSPATATGHLAASTYYNFPKITLGDDTEYRRFHRYINSVNSLNGVFKLIGGYNDPTVSPSTNLNTNHFKPDVFDSDGYRVYTTSQINIVFRYNGSNNYKYYIEKNI